MLSNYRFQIQGIVQGVGFRPFIYRLAREYQLTGTVANTNVGVVIEVHGQSSLIDQFYEKILSQAPLAASIEQIKKEKMPTKKFQAFSILASTQGMNESTGIISDLATCEFCLE